MRGECHNLKPVTETDTSKVPRYDESLGTVVHHVTCSFGLCFVAVFIFMLLLAYNDLTYMLVVIIYLKCLLSIFISIYIFKR